jgi:hypothetical protein
LEAVASVMARPAKGGGEMPPARRAVGPEEYRAMVEGVCRAVAEIAPEGAAVAVVSRGDDALLKFPGRRGWHFPQQADGGYAGHYPRDGAAAVDHLQAVRDKGAEFLVLPETALWWLGHYGELNQYLESHCRQVLRREGVCTVYNLPQPADRPPSNGAAAGRVAAVPT